MTIVFLNEMMNFSSVSFYIRSQTAEELVKLGNDVVIISPEKDLRWFPRREKKNGVNYIFTPGLLPRKLRRGGFGILDLVFKTFYLLFSRCDIIHATAAHRPAQLIPAIITKTIKGTPLVDEWWEWYDRKGRGGERKGKVGAVIAAYDSRFELKSKFIMNHVIAISTGLASRLKEVGFPANQFSVLFGAIEQNSFTTFSLNEVRSELQISNNDIIAGMVSLGRADHDDNKIAIEALINKMYSCDRLKLFVTGEKSYISETFGNLLGSQVLYKGWLKLSEYNKYLSACDFFVLPLIPNSRNIGRWPHKATEYIYMERPIISNWHTDISGIIKENKIGWCVENTLVDYEQVIEDIISKGVIQSDNYKIVKHKFTIQSRAKEINTIYRTL